MLKLFTTLSIGGLLLGCSVGGDQTPPQISVDNDNAARISASGLQQFLALHSSIAVTHNTISANPDYNSPCSVGTYVANFNDLDFSSSLSKGDEIEETYTDCVFNTGNIRVSGLTASKVNDFSDGTYSLDTQHRNLVVTTLGNANSYTFNGPITVTIKNELTLLNIDNAYRNYTVDFKDQSTSIKSGNAFITLNSSAEQYSIKHSLVFSSRGTTGLLRTDTTENVVGLSIDNELMIAGDPSVSATDEDEAINIEQAKIDNNDPDAMTALELAALKDARVAFRPFIGRLRIKSVFDSHYVEMTSEDFDDDSTTYQQNVRANSSTTSTSGHKWIDLL